jgi:hypothetical protein
VRIYPNILPDQKSAVSGSERWFHELVARCELDDRYMAFHSLGLSHHSQKYVGEIDFAFLTPHGILTVEIKGGVISCEDRVWYARDPYGEKVRKLPESPFSQAIQNMYELKDDLVRHTSFRYLKDLLGCGVVFPGCAFDMDGQDVTNEILFDSRTMKMADPVAHIVKKLQIHWGAKLNNGLTVIDPETRTQLERWLKPAFYGVKSLRSDRKARESSMLALLDFQLNFIRSALDNQRILCEGGAGTGKTLIGIEFLRIQKELGACSSPLLLAPQNVCSRLTWTHPELKTWPHERLSELPENGSDLIVVDESQDLMNENDFGQLNFILEGNLDKGKWLFLLDPLNQIGVKGDFDQGWYDILLEMGMKLKLERNVRNTKEIISATLRLTGRDIGVEGTGSGSKIKWIAYDDEDQRKSVLTDLIDELVRQDVRLNEVALIGKAASFTEHGTASDLSESGRKVEDLTPDSLEKNSLEGIVYSNYAEAKGLEFPCVVLDLGEFGAEAFEAPEFYVGMTRATHNLFLLHPNSLKAAIKSTSRKNRPSNPETK